ncbi:MAG: PAS domain S-box protein, partial [Candidatus Thorarchaeota archaeon]|nr:PAS domain S-box protein [Candidatus Thorarchaeota archaeon]
MVEQSIPNIEIGYSLIRGSDPFTVGFDAATKALETILDHPLSVLIIHIKGNNGINEALAGIASVVEEIPVLGFSSTDGSTDPDLIEIRAVSIASPFLNVNVGIGEKISSNWKNTLKNVINTEDMVQYFGPQRTQTWKDLVGVGKSAFGMILTTADQKDNLTPFLKELRAVSENRIPFVGGSTLNISGQKAGHVIHNQNAYSDAIIVAIVETNLRVGASMAHGFIDTGRKLTVTKTKGKSIIEFDDSPAFDVMLSFPNPTRTSLGLVDTYGGSRHIAFNEISKERGVILSEAVPEGTTLSVMQPEGNDLEEAGIEAFNKAVIRGNVEDPILTLVFSSIHRRTMLLDRAIDEIAEARSSRPLMQVVGFDTSGEIGLTDEGLNWHDQSTVSILVLGQNLSHAAEVAMQNKELLGRLSIAEASQRALLDLMPDAILATDQSLTITHWNPQAQKLLGHTKESVMGLNVTNIMHPKLRWTLENKAQALAEGDTNRSISFESEVVKADKTLVPVEVTVSFSPKQERYSFVIAFHDITEHKTSESILDRERKAYKSIAEAAISSTNLDDLCKQTLDGIMETLGYDVGTVRIFDDERQTLRLSAWSGVDESDVEKEFHIMPFEERGYLGADSAFKMEAIFSPSVRNDKSLVDRNMRIEKMGIEAVVAWPLSSSTGDLLGVLNLASYTPKDDSEESRLFFEMLAGMFATVIERRLTQEALGESETKVRTILQSMRDMVFVFD